MRVILLALFAHCVPFPEKPVLAAMPSDLLQSYGTKTFEVPTTAAMEAVSATLRGVGFNIAIADADKGIIRTNRREIRTEIHPTGKGVEMVGYSIQYTRQVTARVVALDEGRSKVSIASRISAGAVWNLQEELVLWELLFRDITELL